MRSILPDWEVELARWLTAVPGAVRAQGEAANVPALRGRVDRGWLLQECSADGGAACTWRL